MKETIIKIKAEDFEGYQEGDIMVEVESNTGYKRKFTPEALSRFNADMEGYLKVQENKEFERKLKKNK